MSLRPPLAVLLFCAVTLAAQTGPSTLTEAQRLFAQHRWAEAARQAATLATSAADETTRSDALLLEAKAEIHIPDLTQAGRSLDRLLQLRPRSAEALYLLGFVQQRRNQPRESLVTFNRAAALQPPTGDDLKLVGLDYVLLGDFHDALHWLERAVALEPGNAEAWYDLARARMHEGLFPEAEAALRRSLQVEPRQPRALDNLGVVLEAENLPDQALASYQQAIDLQARDASPSEQPLLNKAALLNTRGSFAEAARLLEQATAVAPACSHCFEELARAEAGLGRTAAAAAAMEHAIRLDPGNPRLHFQLGRFYKTLGRPTEAQAEFDRSSALYGTRSSEPRQ